jgi:hypothetical protein
MVDPHDGTPKTKKNVVDMALMTDMLVCGFWGGPRLSVGVCFQSVAEGTLICIPPTSADHSNAVYVYT